MLFKNKITTKQMIMVSLLGAISAVLMIIEFQLPFAPTFLKMDFSELPIIIGGFILGPGLGVIIIVIKILLNLLLNGTTTMFVGELSNMILSLAFMLPAAIIYQRDKSKKSAITGLITGTILTSLLAILSNLFVIFPLYASLYGMSLNDIIQMAIVTNPLVKDMTTLVIFALLPFNLFKFTVISLVVMVVYKKLSTVIKKI